jgi:VCBS repeat-containing protein
VVLSDVEAVRFTDGTTRIVGAGGYATVEEAMASELNGMTSQGDAVYVAPITVLNDAGQKAGVAIEEHGDKARGDLDVAVADVLGVGSAVFSVKSAATSAYGSIAVNPASGLWEYTLNNSASAVQALASGQTHEDKFVIRAKDLQGAVADQTVTITIRGDNDGVTITSAGTNALGTVTESDLTILNSVGTIAFNDIDLIDVHTTGVAASVANTLGGTLTMGVVSESATTEGGTVGWTYAVNSSAVQYLAKDETATESFTVTVSDAYGESTTQVVTVTVTGTNDAPTIDATATVATGSTTEDDFLAVLNSTGTIAFSDIDLIDTHTTSVAATNTNTLGGTLTMGAASESATTEGGTVGWTYAVNSSAVQYLAKDETATESFTVTVSDANGGSTTQVVTVTVIGTNDGVTFTSAGSDLTGAVTEDAAVGGFLVDSGTIAFNDVDLKDIHTATVKSSTGTHGLGGTLTLSVDESATTESGTVSWSYQVDNTAVQKLALNERSEERRVGKECRL